MMTLGDRPYLPSLPTYSHFTLASVGLSHKAKSMTLSRSSSERSQGTPKKAMSTSTLVTRHVPSPSRLPQFSVAFSEGTDVSQSGFLR